MPMTTCPDCAREMSDSAPACPGCGRPNVVARKESKSVGFLLGIGILIFPPLFAWFTLRRGYSPVSKAISFSWLIVSLAIVGLQGSSDTSVSKSSPVAKAQAEKIMQVGIRDILSAYKENEIGADNMYKGNLIQFTGIIGNIKKGIFGSLYVILGTGAQFEMPQVYALFDDSMNNQLGQLRKGSKLTVVCRITGLMIYVDAKDCIIK